MRSLLTLVLLTCTGITISAQEWVRQHPFAGFAPLHGITFDDTGNGWAVGQQSLILHTDNWGDIWKVQGGIPIGHTFVAVEIVPGTNSQTVLVGGPGIYWTTDGGDTWQYMSTQIHVSAIHRIHAFDDQNWVVMGNSQGARTADGGMTWTEFSMPSNGTSTSWFNSPDHGWASNGPFNAYTLHVTHDGGENWTMVDDATYPIITDIAMIDDQTGYMSARDYIFKTTNGGVDWTQLHDDVQPSLTGMRVVNENIVWSGLNNGFVFFTLDGGENWTQLNPNIISSNRIEDIYALPDGRVWAPGRYGSIIYSDNSGQTWRDQTPGVKNPLFDIQFAGDAGIAGGNDGVILHTTNGGVIWENIGYDPESTYSAVALYNAGGTNHIYLGTTRGKVIHGTLEDLEWQTISEDIDANINTLCAVNTQTLFSGSIGRIQRTTNGGANWDIVASTGNQVSEIGFPTEQTGFATVHDGTVLKTTDGGTTWDTILTRTHTIRFGGLHFPNTEEGWVVAEFIDSVYITKDGGASWNTFPLPVATFWKDIEFMNADTGYISGGSSGQGIVLRTTDGGESWERVFDDTEALRRMYVRPDADFVWIVGNGGTIVHFSPCAVSPVISNLSGETGPCERSVVSYEIDAEGATLFTWGVPSDWQIAGNDNSSRIDVRVGSQSGEITIQARNSCGTPTETLAIQVDPRETEAVVIAESAGTLSTTTTGTAYQWHLDDTPLPGATMQNYTPTESGSYTLDVAFANGCSVTSNAIEVIISGISRASNHTITVFPNPTNRTLTLIGMPEIAGEIYMLDLSGRTVTVIDKNNTQIDVSMLESGVYFLHVETAEAVYTARFAKF